MVDEVSENVAREGRRIARETGHELLAEVASRKCVELQALNNALMDTYRVHQDVDAFSLLFELNTRPFSMIAARIMRMTGCRADINDIIQEAFLAIYRYPTRFCPDKPNAFRNWSYSIIRNTVYRHAQNRARDGIPVEMLAEVLQDTQTTPPPQATENGEQDEACKRVYALLLTIYTDVYARELKPRDRLALELVEIHRLGYRDAAAVVGVRLENFKMIVCRARKKIFQSMVRTLGTRQP